MKKSTCFFFVLFFFGSFHLFAGNIIVNQSNKNQLQIQENTYSVLRLKSMVYSVDFSEVSTQNGTFTQLNIPGYGFSLIVGEPKLPVLKELIEIPLEAEANIKIINKAFKEFNLSDFCINNPVIPAQAPVSKDIDDPATIEFIINENSYSKDQFLGQELIKVKILGTMRGVRFARLEIAPVQYNPVTNTIRVFEEIEVEISFTGGNTALSESKKKSLFSPYFEKIYSKLINYKPLPTDELITNAPVTYVIVSDPMFESDLQDFIQWKTKKGFRVIQAYTDDPAVGNTTSSIKAYLENLYNNPQAGYHPQSFILFVGDVDQIPSFNGTVSYHVTDLYYSEYTGDVYPECYYGRFSANNLSELQPQIFKTLEYEQYQFPEPPFLDSVVLISGYASGYDTLWGNGQINYAATYYLNEDHGIFPFIYSQPADTNYAQLIKQNINNGISFLNYTGHCSPFGFSNPSLNISHITELFNVNKYPLMIGNCCSSASFNMTCFGEEIVRAADKGALSYIGAASSTYWDEDYWWAVGYKDISPYPVYDPDNLGFYDRLFHDHGEPLDEWYVTQGQFPAAGNLAVTQAGSGMETYYWETYNLLGDPSVCIYMPQPLLPEVNYASSITVGDITFTVSTEPYLYVALSMNGVLHGAAVSDENGLAEIEIFEPITQPGTADIVITGQNIEPFFGTVNSVVTSSSEYTAMNSVDRINIYPNPFNDEFVVDYYLQTTSDVNISVLDLLGQEVALIENTVNKPGGQHKVMFRADEMQPGVYFCRIEAGTFSVVRKLILAR